MTNEETIKTIMLGYDMLINQAKVLASLPLEDWERAFEKFETIGPLIDPTLYREVIYSKKCKVIRMLIKAAIPLKHAVEEAQEIILSEMTTHGKIT